MSDSASLLERLAGLHPRAIDLDLSRIERLLERLGHPERALPPVIHVAGTNGKGSVIANLRAMAEAAGHRVHVYTSPHLVEFRERIRLAGHLIDEPSLAALLAECEAANDGAPITLFEITTAAAFLAFARNDAELLLLETGLGGRLDATNVVERPLATILMPVSLDHQQYLGETIAAITAEKAGIMKSGVPAILAAQVAEAQRVFLARAAHIGAPVVAYGADYRFRVHATDWTYEDSAGRLTLPQPSLMGDHQYGNAAVAIAAIRALPDLGIADRHIRQGLGKTSWPARLQRLGRGPLVARYPDCAIWLDGGHNEAAAAMLARQIAAWTAKDGAPTDIIFSMLRSKDVKSFLAPFKGHIGALLCVPMAPDHDGYAPAEIVAIARELSLAATEAVDIAHAMAMIPQSRRVLICGSLYLAGEVLRDHG
ncbi:MAG TPA: Mur ligase family protein [Dongiaceae bacterium]|nr:Mur ligase family protein [Dongiaceae bacterium]